MAVTIKQIAQSSGVSRGTVDRVLNNRGRVSKETEQLVKQVAEKLGYKPNMAGKALAARKKNFLIGIILCSEGNEFYNDVMRGIHKAEEEALEYGVKIVLKTMKGYDVDTQLKLMDDMKDNINCLVLNAINDERIAKRINVFVEEKIPVITINTDIENSNRICFVGSNYRKSGETACGMLGLLTGGTASVGIATGSVKVLGHNQRITGFQTVCKSKYPNMNIVDIIETNDDDNIGYKETLLMLKEHGEIDALYIVAAGAAGVCKAVKEMKKEITVIACDATPAMMKVVQGGIVQATICQQPYTQGYKSITLAVQTLVNGIVPDKDMYFVKNEIKINENLL